MMEQATGVIGGVDCHSRTHHAVVLDYRGRQLGDAEFPATAVGYRALHRWMASFGEIQAVGAESTSAYGAALTRWLTSNGVRVLEVNQPHKHLRSRKGKSDPIDAEAAARRVLAGEVRVIPKDTTGVVESIRQLRVAREGALKARSAALCQLGDLLVTAPPELRESLTRKTLKGQARLCAKLRPDVRRLSQPLQAAKFALRSLARRVADLDEEIDQLDQELRTLVRQAAPRTTELLGVGIQHAGQLLVTAGENIERLRSEAAFAHLCAAAPISASSGLTQRHRLNPGGDRSANRTLHMIAVVRLRYCERTRAYAVRRTREGLSKREVIRCLKRYIARELYHSLCADLGRISPAKALDAV
jgi:transposase